MTKEGIILKATLRYLKNTYPLYLMLAVPILYFIIFKYIPMYGTVLAFKNYNMFSDGLFAGEWVGFAHFKEAFSAIEFQHAMINTLVLNFGDLIIGFPIPIILAIALNELRSDKIRKTTQIITYLPNFLSWIIIAGISFQLFSNSGLINNILASMGLDKVNFLSEPFKWRIVYWASGVWQGAGYGLIIYLAALMSIDPTLFEAAYIDGATKMQRIIHVTVPMIRSTIVIMFIMAVGGIMNISFDRPYLMGNALVSDASSVISTYSYNVGISAARFDFATAIGLFQSVVGIILLLTADKIAKKLGEGGLL
jgi:putative aldouronate transport system permease protein